MKTTTTMMAVLAVAMMMSAAMPVQAEFSTSATASVSCVKMNNSQLYQTGGSASGSASGDNSDVGATYTASAKVNAGSAQGSHTDSGSWPVKNSANAEVPQLTGIAFKGDAVSAAGEGTATSQLNHDSKSISVGATCGAGEPEGDGAGGGGECVASVNIASNGRFKLLTVPDACAVEMPGNTVRFFDRGGSLMHQDTIHFA